MKLFFFGTLMDPEVREIVMGRSMPDDAVEPALAQGFRRVFVAGRHYPMLLPHASGWVDGLLVSGVDPESLHRLQVYEGWEYSLTPMRVRTQSGRTVMAHVFMCPPHIKPEKKDWRLDRWQMRHKRHFLPKTQAMMERAARLNAPGVAAAASGGHPRPALAPKLKRK